MRIWFMSDIHLEFGKCRIREVPDCDVIVLAGDIGWGAQGWDWSEKNLGHLNKPVIFICGNHEFYSSKMSIYQLYAHLGAKEHEHIKLLQNGVREIDDVVFVGGTLWTDFNLTSNRDIDMLNADKAINDYKWITYRINTRNSLITPENILEENQITTQVIKTEITKAKTAGKKVVVVTHHAPFEKSCSEDFKGDPDNVYYVNSFDRDYDFPLPDMWIHGHLHNTTDYMIGECHVVTNPRGYVGVALNPNFDPMKVVDI